MDDRHKQHVDQHKHRYRAERQAERWDHGEIIPQAAERASQVNSPRGPAGSGRSRRSFRCGRNREACLCRPAVDRHLWTTQESPAAEEAENDEKSARNRDHSSDGNRSPDLAGDRVTIDSDSSVQNPRSAEDGDGRDHSDQPNATTWASNLGQSVEQKSTVIVNCLKRDDATSRERKRDVEPLVAYQLRIKVLKVPLPHRRDRSLSDIESGEGPTHDGAEVGAREPNTQFVSTKPAARLNGTPGVPLDCEDGSRRSQCHIKVFPSERQSDSSGRRPNAAPSW